jgi:hypothetical protein
MAKPERSPPLSNFYRPCMMCEWGENAGKQKIIGLKQRSRAK